MEKFENSIDPEKFRATNALWNKLTLNSPWSVGYVSFLIESENFKTKEDWESFYYRSGEKRRTILAEKSEAIQRFLDFHLMKKTKPKNIEKTPSEYKRLNYYFGRTKAELREKAIVLFKEMESSETKISLSECIDSVRFRVICETWNGIILRERNTVEQLRKLFPEIIFEKVRGDFDHCFAVDYQLFTSEKLLCAIQIKPKSYTFQTEYIRKARTANRRKNRKYYQKFSVPVFDIIANTEGKILNPVVLRQIREQNIFQK